MATRLMNLDFIDVNPAMEAYRTGQRFDMAQQLADARLEEQRQQNEFNRQADPLRLQTLKSSASTAATRAKYAESDVQSQLSARDAQTQLSVLREMYKRYDAGDLAGGDEVARLAKAPISPELRSNAEARKVIKDFDAEAQRRYPDMPAAQLDYLKKGMAHVGQKRQRGEPIDPGTIFDVPDAPTPPEQKKPATAGKGYQLYVEPGTDAEGKPTHRARRFNQSTGELEDVPGGETVGPLQRPGGAAAGRPTALQSNIQALIDKKIAGNEKEAFDLLQLGKSNPNEARGRVYNNALGNTLRSTFGNEEQRQGQARKAAEEAVRHWDSLNSKAPERAPGVQPSRSAPGTSAAPPGVTYDRPEISQAREAIGRGVPRARIEQRLRERGIPFEPADLDL